MNSYFVRHTEKLSVERSDLECLWEESRIAIHYPEYLGVLREADNNSRCPEDYKGQANTSMRCLKELGDNGGYVWTQSLVSEYARVGVVRPGTGIELCEATWHVADGEGHRKPGDRAILKTLPLQDKVRLVSPGEAMGLRAGRPQQGTILRWHNCGSRLADLVEGKHTAQEFGNLSTGQQEAACAEFLRLSRDVPDLPRLRLLLLPVGRTLEDVDIYGLDEGGRKVFAQVTYAREKTKEAKDKLERLKKYASGDAHLLMFCRCETPGERDGVRVVSVEGEVAPWLRYDPEHARAVWG